MEKIRRFFSLQIMVGIVILVASIAVFSILGLYTRYLSDDYCFASNLKNAPNFLAAQMHLYETWSGRFSATFLINLGDLFGPYNTILWPSLLFALMIGTGSYLARQVLVGWPKRAALLYVVLFVDFIYIFSPNRYQSYYWRPGIASYTIAIPGFLLLSAFILKSARLDIRGLKYMLHLGMIVLLSLFIGGLSETVGVELTGAIVLSGILATLVLRGTQRRHTLILLTASFLGSVASVLIMALAPGTTVRKALMPVSPSYLTILALSLRYAVDFIYTTVKGLPLPFLGLIGTSFLLAFGLKRLNLLQTPFSPRRSLIAALVAALVTYVLIVGVFIPGLYAYDAYAENRVLVLAVAILTLGVMSVTGMSGLWFADLLPRTGGTVVPAAVLALFLVSTLYPMRGAWTISRQFPDFRHRASEWDARHALIVKAAVSKTADVHVVEFDSLDGLQELVSDPHNWVNQCAAQFYGVGSIQASEP